MSGVFLFLFCFFFFFFFLDIENLYLSKRLIFFIMLSDLTPEMISK